MTQQSNNHNDNGNNNEELSLTIPMGTQQQQFQCSICRILPTEIAVIQCDTGHIICGHCHSNQHFDKRCPICRRDMSTKIRNLCLEQLLQRCVIIECKYKSIGCNWQGLKQNKKNHEIQCRQNRKISADQALDLMTKNKILTNFLLSAPKLNRFCFDVLPLASSFEEIDGFSVAIVINDLQNQPAISFHFMHIIGRSRIELEYATRARVKYEAYLIVSKQGGTVEESAMISVDSIYKNWISTYVAKTKVVLPNFQYNADIQYSLTVLVKEFKY